jgi:hypothetical protein
MKLATDVNISFVTVPIEALVHPLCVIPDSGDDRDIYFVVLPKCNWSQFFGERIIITNNNGICHELPYSSYEPVILEKD